MGSSFFEGLHLLSKMSIWLIYAHLCLCHYIIMYPRLVAEILNINKRLILYKESLHNKKLLKNT